MVVSEVASRYARALFELAIENESSKNVLSQLRGLREILENDSNLMEFLQSPLIKTDNKKRVLQKALKDAGLLAEVESFLLLLAGKDRLPLFGEILESYQSQMDLENGITRGVVRSASVLSNEDRNRIQEIVSNYTKKNVILTFEEDDKLLGGLVAHVGSYTFDDTLTPHLKRIKEELNRIAH